MDAVEFEKVRAGTSKYLISVSKLAGKKIADIEGYVSEEFGDLVFKVTKIIFEDATHVSFGAEHDIAYIEDYSKDSRFHPEYLEKFRDDDDD